MVCGPDRSCTTLIVLDFFAADCETFAVSLSGQSDERMSYLSEWEKRSTYLPDREQWRQCSTARACASSLLELAECCQRPLVLLMVNFMYEMTCSNNTHRRGPWIPRVALYAHCRLLGRGGSACRGVLDQLQWLVSTTS